MDKPMTQDEVLAVLDDAADYIRHDATAAAYQLCDRLREARATIAAWNVSPSADVDWRGMYRFQTAMRYMDNRASLTKEDAYRMADEDVAWLERAQLAQQGGESKDG